MAKRPPLSPEKKEWVKNRTVTIVGTPLNHNASLQMRYRAAIRALVREMQKTTRIEIEKLFKSDTAEAFIEQQERAEAMDSKDSITTRAKKLTASLTERFTNLFAKRAPGLSKDMLGQIDATSDRSLQSSLQKLTGGMELNTSIVPQGMEAVSAAIIEENVSLITSIPQEYFKNITGAVMRSITTGDGLKTLVPAISKIDGVTDRRAKNIALDQTRKAYNLINKQRMQSIGVKQFRWLHSQGGAHPRKSHLSISGKTFSFENIISEQIAAGVTNPNDQGLPGVPINCGCRFIPILNFDNAQ